MTKIKNIVRKIKCEEVILLAALILNGGFNEFISFIIATVLSIVLIIKIVKKGLFRININIVSISIKEKYKLLDFGIIILLIGMLLLTGSRAVFVLAMLSNIYIMICCNSCLILVGYHVYCLLQE